jgi:hypothetical protein
VLDSSSSSLTWADSSSSIMASHRAMVAHQGVMVKMATGKGIEVPRVVVVPLGEDALLMDSSMLDGTRMASAMMMSMSPTERNTTKNMTKRSHKNQSIRPQTESISPK